MKIYKLSRTFDIKDLKDNEVKTGCTYLDMYIEKAELVCEDVKVKTLFSYDGIYLDCKPSIKLKDDKVIVSEFVEVEDGVIRPMFEFEEMLKEDFDPNIDVAYWPAKNSSFYLGGKRWGDLSEEFQKTLLSNSYDFYWDEEDRSRNLLHFYDIEAPRKNTIAKKATFYFWEPLHFQIGSVKNED